MTRLTGLTPQDFQRGGEGLKQHIEAYEAVRVELDRLDPAGVARRNAESTSLIERLRQGFAAQFSTLPPGQQK
jgi:DNA-directed RNA polymerase specialized sigma54-like protein